MLWPASAKFSCRGIPMTEARAKDIRVAPISSSDAAALVKRVHYSGKVVQNSQLHLGVFLNGKLEGAMQFGPSLDKRKTQGMVEGTAWNGFLELNRMAFSDKLPRNSESRAISIALKMIRKHYPHIEWIISFADGTQCGDGTIYRASGFVLTSIKKNTSIWRAPDGSTATDLSLRLGLQAKKSATISKTTVTKGKAITSTGASSMKGFREAGYAPMPGYQLRYIYFLNPAARERLTVPIVPFDKIDAIGAGMYKGQRIDRASRRPKQAMTGLPPEQRRCDTDPGAPSTQGEAA